MGSGYDESRRLGSILIQSSLLPKSSEYKDFQTQAQKSPFGGDQPSISISGNPLWPPSPYGSIFDEVLRHLTMFQKKGIITVRLAVEMNASKGE